MKTIIFDTETTGLLQPSNTPLVNQPRIIEIGAVAVFDDALEPTKLKTFISPGVPISEEITKITGITDEDVKSAPSFGEFFDVLLAFWKGADGCIAHNMSFDQGMFDVECRRLGKTFPWPKKMICTVQEYSAQFGYRPKMKEVYEKVIGKPLAQTHRALDDAYALYEIISNDEAFKALGM